MKQPVKKAHIELHCHTAYSMDGLMEFEALTQAARQIGLDAVTITDHDTMEGAFEFGRRARAEDCPVHIIAGEERTLLDGSHLIGIFLQEPIASQTLPEAIGEIQSQGGLCLIPHPFRKKDGLFRDGLERLELFRGGCVGFEIFNAKCSAADNRKARELVPEWLGPFGGSDAHYDSDLGECVNVVSWQDDWRTSVMRMLERRTPVQILGKAQGEADGERRYAPLYYRYRKFVRLPKPLVPFARSCYRWYRNRRYGVGKKPLSEVYARA